MSILASLQTTAVMLTGQRVHYFWDDNNSYIRDESIFIQRNPLRVNDPLHMIIVWKAINIQLCSSLLYTEEIEDPPEDHFVLGVAQILEGYRTEQLMKGSFPGFDLYFELLHFITASPSETETFFDCLRNGVLRFVNSCDREALGFLKCKDEVIELLLAEVKALRSFSDACDLSSRKSPIARGKRSSS